MGPRDLGFSEAGCQEVEDFWMCPLRPRETIGKNGLEVGDDDAGVDHTLFVETIGDELENEAVEEAVVPKTIRDPLAPTKAQWLAHQTTHLPFRSWCPECVVGRSDNPGHRRVTSE